MADLERCGGLSQHISPFVEVQDLGNLLNRCGFTMLTIDSDEMKVRLTYAFNFSVTHSCNIVSQVGYSSVIRLMEDLKGMAENNAAWARKPNLGRDT